MGISFIKERKYQAFAFVPEDWKRNAATVAAFGISISTRRGHIQGLVYHWNIDLSRKYSRHKRGIGFATTR